MDKELLARRLYVERVSSLMGDQPIDQSMLDSMWRSKVSPEEAARAMQATEVEHHGFEPAPWLQRYLSRK